MRYAVDINSILCVCMYMRALRFVAIAVGLFGIGLAYNHVRLVMDVEKRRSVEPKKRRLVLLDLLDIVTRAAGTSRTTPFLLYGTLLGQVRSDDLICYDFDLDFGIEDTSYERLKTELHRAISARSTEYYVDIKEVMGYRALEIIHKDTRISADITPFSEHRQSGTVSRDIPSWYSTLYLKECRAEYPKDWIYPLKKIEFLGKKTHIPNKARKLLACYYGKQFMTPDHVCNASCTQCVKVF